MAIENVDLEGVKLFAKGKVRSIFDLGEELVIATTDKISAFDVVLPSLIDKKGIVLTQISNFWFDFLKENKIVNNHVVTANVDEMGEPFASNKDRLQGRSIKVKKAERIDIECIVRGYIEGSGLKEYNKTGKICGIELPKGLIRADKLEEPIFTPSTKADEGHDENISYERMLEIVGEDVGKKLKDLSLAIYTCARDYAATRGIIIADTKFEFGIVDGEVILIDEALTPDSSRFWPADDYEPGRAQKSFDKQYIRDYLETLDWAKCYPGPVLPEEVCAKTTEKYVEAYETLTGKKFEF